ncbi:hypothetical protein ACHAWU_005191 [Discostella pseudostelligera]|uniref:JmjC domain-containing protein n=1 Tax=Discostella pseudostelligera TaxID=259834 RepID=A0ABD3MEN1_9STRA
MISEQPSTSRLDLEHGLPPDPGYDHPGCIDVLLPASQSQPSPSNNSAATPNLLSAGCSPQARRRRHPYATTPSYPIELYDDERLMPIIVPAAEQQCEYHLNKKRRNDAEQRQYQHDVRRSSNDDDSYSGSRHRAHWNAFRKYLERYKPVKIQDVALFREDRFTNTTTFTNNSERGKSNANSGRPVALSSDIHSLPPHILDMEITVQCAFHSPSSPPSTTTTNGTSINNICNKQQPLSAQEIDMAMSSSYTNTIDLQQFIPTFMGQEDQVTTEMSLREAIEWNNPASSSMAVCVAQLPIATAAERISGIDCDGDCDQIDNHHDDDHRSIRLRLDGTIEQFPSNCTANGDNALMSHLSLMLCLPSYLLLGVTNANDDDEGTAHKDDANNTNAIVIQSVNLWHAPQTCCTNVHYDDHDNLLIVTEGTKTVELCPPGCIRASGIYSEHANHPALLRKLVRRVHCHRDDGNNRRDEDEESTQSEIEVTRNLKKKRTHIISISAGEALYIPSGWWHRVESTPSSSNVGCTAINVWFDYKHSSRSNVPKHMLPFQLRCVARRYYEMHADHAANVLLERKRRQARVVQLICDDDVPAKGSSINLELGWELLKGKGSASQNDIKAFCNTFSESWTRLMNEFDTADESSTQSMAYETVDRFRSQLDYFLLHLNLRDTGHVKALVQLWTALPLSGNGIARDEDRLFSKLILELSPESCFIVTQAWERHASRTDDCAKQAEVSFKHFFELAGGGEWEKKHSATTSIVYHYEYMSNDQHGFVQLDESGAY